MDSRRNFLRGIAQAAAGAGSKPADPAGRIEAVPPPSGAPTSHERYATQLSVPGWSDEIQAALSAASVLVVGAGSLGSPVASYLAGAGVGRLGIADGGTVELAGLHRQHLHFTPDVGVAKANSAAAKLAFLNPEIVVEPYHVRLEEANADALVAGQDLVVDCSNDQETGRLINTACCRAGTGLVSVRAAGTAGTILGVRPGETGCLRCAEDVGEVGSSQAAAAVLGPVAGALGSFAALAALDLLGAGGPDTGAGLVILDVAEPAAKRVAVPRRRGCPDCGER